jgi:hypothetical protein
MLHLDIFGFVHETAILNVQLQYSSKKWHTGRLFWSSAHPRRDPATWLPPPLLPFPHLAAVGSRPPRPPPPLLPFPHLAAAGSRPPRPPQGSIHLDGTAAPPFPQPRRRREPDHSRRPVGAHPSREATMSRLPVGTPLSGGWTPRRRGASSPSSVGSSSIFPDAASMRFARDFAQELRRFETRFNRKRNEKLFETKRPKYPSGGGTPPVFPAIRACTPWDARGVPEHRGRWII